MAVDDAFLRRAADEIAGVLVPRGNELVAAVEQVDEPGRPGLEVVPGRAEPARDEPLGDVARTGWGRRAWVDLGHDRPLGTRLLAEAVEQRVEDRVRVRCVPIPERAVRDVRDGPAEPGVPDEELRQTPDRAALPGHEHADGPLPRRRIRLAPRPGLQRVRLGSRGDERVPRGAIARAGEADLHQRGAAWPIVLRTSRATAASSHGSGSVRADDRSLVALPGEQHDIARARSLECRLDRGAPIRDQQQVVTAPPARRVRRPARSRRESVRGPRRADPRR